MAVIAPADSSLLCAALLRKGWRLTEAGAAQCADLAVSMDTKQPQRAASPDQVINAALNCDLRDIGAAWLPEKLARAESLALPPGSNCVVVQLAKLRNVAAPKDNEESRSAPRLLRLTLTDGHNSVSALDVDGSVTRLGLDTPPGTKLRLEGSLPVQDGFLMLSQSNVSLLGGQVGALVEVWSLRKALTEIGGSTAGLGVRARRPAEGGPPAWTSFQPAGKKAGAVGKAAGKEGAAGTGRFKSLAVAGADKEPDEAAAAEQLEFSAQRQEVIRQAKNAAGGAQRHFSAAPTAQLPPAPGASHGKGAVSADLAKLQDMGFSAAQSQAALRQHKGSVDRALDSLLASAGGPMTQLRLDSGRAPAGARGGRGAGGRGGRGGGRGGRRGRNGSDDELDYGDDGHSARPTAGVSLFDFIGGKFESGATPTAAAARQAPPPPQQQRQRQKQDEYPPPGAQSVSFHQPQQQQRQRQKQDEYPPPGAQSVSFHQPQQQHQTAPPKQHHAKQQHSQPAPPKQQHAKQQHSQPAPPKQQHARQQQQQQQQQQPPHQKQGDRPAHRAESTGSHQKSRQQKPPSSARASQGPQPPAAPAPHALLQDPGLARPPSNSQDSRRSAGAGRGRGGRAADGVRLPEGDHCLAQWLDGHYYPAVLQCYLGNGLARVVWPAYGESGDVPQHALRAPDVPGAGAAARHAGAGGGGYPRREFYSSNKL